jgi:hypothetical protein
MNNELIALAIEQIGTLGELIEGHVGEDCAEVKLAKQIIKLLKLAAKEAK